MVFSRTHFIVSFLVVLIPIAASFSFNFATIGPQNQNRDIVTEGDGAYISDGGIQVTPDGIGSNRSRKAGRATFIRPLHLWDNRAMGLPVNLTTIEPMSRFVAVEFDTYWTKWLSNVTGGGVCQAWIRYDSGSRNLSVSFTGYQNGTVVRQDGLVYTVDLRNELPEWVIFGFTAATGADFQKHNVRSWTFDSSDLQEEEE
ncbi:hypothetical protein L1987_26942 [Smallanthus sonchifolius]|uniref:Uncharacterized protein n=1 Tax=Smallanthus sonchifolius TaxID=185202 RepID=A0ACB9IAE6_9ASTR|nr:hypothetical protein L1987_26942 [Smallanthus sonchifolius]